MRLCVLLPVLQMREMMERAGNSHLLTVLSYKNAGHLIEPPFTPFTRASTFKTVTNPPFTSMFPSEQEDVSLKVKLTSPDFEF